MSIELELTETANVSTPHPTPVIILPEYSIERFLAKKIKSHPSSKGTAPAMMANFRPIRSTALPPIIPPNKAPSASVDCNENTDLDQQRGSSESSTHPRPLQLALLICSFAFYCYYVVFLGNTLYSHSASLEPGGNPVRD